MSPFAVRIEDRVGKVGESSLIRKIRTWLGTASPPAPYGIGDDCAVVPKIAGKLLVTVDPVVYGVHFDASLQAKLAGEKLFKRNLSDIAAMGGTPKAAVVALSLEPTISLAWLKGFYQGLAAVSKKYHVPVVGGDVTKQEGFAASLTLIGEAGPRILTRSGAKLGDAIYVTGELGMSFSTEHHARFIPRLKEGAWLAAHREVRSLIDVSDGVAKDLWTLNPAGAEPSLYPRRIPRRDQATVRQALTEGEDYELLFTLSKNADQGAFERAWARAFPKVRLSRIGQFVKKGTAGPSSLDHLHGYEHLQ